MGCFYFTCPPFPHLLCSRLYPRVTAEACVSDSTNPCHTCPHSFWHGSNAISLLLGILADKNVLCTIRHDRPCEHVSPQVAYPEKPAEPKTEPLLSGNGFCLPLGKDLHDPAVSLTSPNCACITETKHRDFSLEVQLDSNYSVVYLFVKYVYFTHFGMRDLQIFNICTGFEDLWSLKWSRFEYCFNLKEVSNIELIIWM